MERISDVFKILKSGELDEKLKEIGCFDIDVSKKRIENVIKKFKSCFGAADDTLISICSAPGRTEIGGNHTDHQRGHVLAAAVTMDFLACAAFNDTNMVRFQSEGWPITAIDLTNMEPIDEEKETTAALLRGVFARLKDRGYELKGCDIYAVSDVLPGSGLSSSAACEVLIGVIGNHLFCNDELDAVTIAQISQYAENNYFGKPSGLMDQMASSVGAAVSIDFKNSKIPKIRMIEADLSAMGLALCIIDSGASHAALTNEYASIPNEMCSVAKCFGKDVLSEVAEEDVLCSLKEIREAVGDRAVLRAFHYYADDKRAVQEADALQNKDKEKFLQLIRESGKSSWELLQNITPTGGVKDQAMAIAITAVEKLLNGSGACRVHGGGFAGTVQAFVPKDGLENFKKNIEKLLGKGCCHILDIRKVGGVVLIA